MRKIVISILVFILVFSELNIFVAETIVEDPTEPEIECEELLESDSEENLATECKESESENVGNSTTEGEEQPGSGSSEDLTTEGKEKPESGSGEDLTTEGKEQPEFENGKNPESENGEDLTTEGEKESESGNTENLENACGESQQESENEENLVTEGEKQSGVDAEEKAIDCEEEEEPHEENLEIDCVEGFDSEEELAIEDEKQLESNREEELVTEGEEQEGVDSKENTAPACNRFGPSREGIPVSSVGQIKNIDFSELDKGDSLEGFTQLTVNEGLALNTQDAKGRKYYMYFGDLSNNRSLASLNDQFSFLQYNDDWLRPLPNPNDTLENVVKNSKYVSASYTQIATALNVDPFLNDGIVTYYYSGGIASGDKRGNGLTIAHGYTENDFPKYATTQMPILKLYKNEKTSELVAYAAVVYVLSDAYLQGYIKIKMSPVSNIGRANVNVKYLEKSGFYPYTNLGYTAHLDIAKRHEKSRMYSLGNDRGLYLHEKRMNDGQDYYLYFFRDGYANHPVAMRGNDDAMEAIAFGNYNFTALNGMGIKDPGQDKMYPYTIHPGWAYRWEPKSQGLGSIREENLQMAVTDKPIPPEPPTPESPPVLKLDDSGYTDNGYRITGTWKDADSNYVSLFYIVIGRGGPQKIGEYKNPNPNTDVPWEYTIPSAKVEEGLDHDILVYAFDDTDKYSNTEEIYINPLLTIKEKVFDADGNEPSKVEPGETLKYEILVDTGYSTEDKGTYSGVTITQKHDEHLEPPTDLKVIDGSGNEMGTATYNPSTNTIEAKPYTDASRSKKVKVTFNAKVKDNAAEGEFVVGQATASGKYSTGVEVNKTSNEVKIIITGMTGVLEFVSAPKMIDFGEKLSIAPQNKTYHPIDFDTPLAVKDNRSLSKRPSWAMTAKLDQPLTGKKTGSTLDSLHYNYGGNVSILTEDASVQIYKKETTSKEVVNISDTWNPDGDGLYLEVTAGTAKADAYEGTIRWVLQDVPVNE